MIYLSLIVVICNLTARANAFLGKQFNQFAKEWETFSRQLDMASRSREKLDTRVNRITNKFDAISGNEELDQIEENNDTKD